MPQRHICMFADERSIHTKRWVEGLRQYGHRVDLVTLKKDNENNFGAIDLGAKSKAGYFLKIGALKKVVKELNPDILHSHFASSYGFLASYVDHPKKVLSVWGDDVIIFPYNSKFYRYFAKRAIRNSHYITATSKILKDTVLDLDKSVENISIIPFGVDINLFKFIERKSKSDVVIGITKSLWPKYGIDILINAFYRVAKSEKNIKLLIAGKGGHEKEYKKLVSELKLNDKVSFVGYIQNNDLPVFLKKLDIYAMPSISKGESFGVAAVEASATGLPVVATNIGGIPEVVDHEITGLLVEKNNIQQLADALLRLIKDPEIRYKMGISGRKKVESEFVWKDNIKMMSALYEEILK